MKAIRNTFMAIIMLILYSPIFVMIFFSFNSAKSTSVFKGFSLRWYESLSTNAELTNGLINTIIIALLSATIATILGTITAVGIMNMKKRWIKNSVLSITNIPLMNPEIVTGISMMLMFVFIGKMLQLADSVNFFTILIAHITFNLPYVILNVLPKLKQTDEHLTEAAEDLGCSPLQAFFKAVLPSITSGIIVGFIMALTMSLDDFVISYFTGGTFQTLPIVIYSKVKRSFSPEIYALETIMFLVILILMILLNVIQSKSDKKTIKRRK